MDFDQFYAKTPATIDEIGWWVSRALERHPLCRNVEFDIVSMPRTGKKSNWTISLRSVAPDALWEASDIVSDIQEAYDLAVAAYFDGFGEIPRFLAGTVRCDGMVKPQLPSSFPGDSAFERSGDRFASGKRGPFSGNGDHF